MSNYIDIKAVKAQLDLPAVLSHYNIQHKTGVDQDKIICPFHDDHEPSCSINKSKGIFNCFPCGAKGNAIDFVCQMENLDPNDKEQFKQTLEYIVEEILGEEVDHITRAGGKGFQKKASKSKAKKSVVKQPKKEDQANNVKENKPLKFTLQHLETDVSFFAEHGLSDETIETFGLGLCNKGMMAGRIVIPIHNKKGEIVAYIGRWPDNETIPEGEGKYKAPKGFHKGLELFNQHRVCGIGIVDYESAFNIVVEGFWSVMRLHNAGYPVVATMSTQVSNEQIKAIAELGEDVLIIFDGDDAGREGAKRLAAELSRYVFVRILDLPDGIKPDTMDLELLEYVE